MKYIKIFDICGLVAICLGLIYGMYLVPESITVGIAPAILYASVIFLGPSSYKIYIVGIIAAALGTFIILFALYIPDIILISMLVAVSIRTLYLYQSKGK